MNWHVLNLFPVLVFFISLNNQLKFISYCLIEYPIFHSLFLFEILIFLFLNPYKITIKFDLWFPIFLVLFFE